MPRRQRLSNVMTKPGGHRSRRHLDERELVQAVDASVALQQLLAAASAPPTPAELQGLARALDGFRAMRRRGRSDPTGVRPVGRTGRRTRQRWPGGRRWPRSSWWPAQRSSCCSAVPPRPPAGQLTTALQDAVSDLVNGSGSVHGPGSVNGPDRPLAARSQDRQGPAGIGTISRRARALPDNWATSMNPMTGSACLPIRRLRAAVLLAWRLPACCC